MDTTVLIQVSILNNFMHFSIAFFGADEQIATAKPFFESFFIKSEAPGISCTLLSYRDNARSIIASSISGTLTGAMTSLTKSATLRPSYAKNTFLLT